MNRYSEAWNKHVDYMGWITNPEPSWVESFTMIKACKASEVKLYCTFKVYLN